MSTLGWIAASIATAIAVAAAGAVTLAKVADTYGNDPVGGDTDE